MAKPRYDSFVAEELEKIKGVYYPVKAGFLRRVFIHSLDISKLHPNPYDVFCSPDVGPNEGIISHYKEVYREIGQDLSNLAYSKSPALAPLDVEKTHPDGYMILNGHHRWRAARQAGMKKLPVRIVDLTQKSDIQKMIDSSGFNRRVSLDLDDIVFRPESDHSLEKPLPFPLNRIYRERLRLGIPSLFNMLNKNGYDIWIYTAQYYSLDYLRHYFKHYRVHITGIVTGTARQSPSGTDTRKELEKLLEKKYESTVHIDNESLIRTVKGAHDFEEYCLNGTSDTWSRDVVDAFEEMKKHE